MAAADPSGLVDDLVNRHLLVRGEAGEYSFRHALTRDAVYATLLRAERRALHAAVGKSIESLYAGQLDAHLGDLAYHYYEAEEWEHATAYAGQAGARALAAFANREAIEHFSRAIAAAGQQPAAPGLAALHRARGQAHDITGQFERARADHAAALALARAAGDRRAEWQALVDLGLLWASRNYEQTGDYMQQALALARAMDDKTVLGQTLNRAGNWHLNLLEYDDAVRYHHEALEVFRGLHDTRGLAETLDLLGIASVTGGDPPAGFRFLQQAADLWTQIGARRGLIYSQSSIALCTYTYQCQTLVPVQVPQAEAIGPVEIALASAREMGWRSAEAYALFMIGTCLGARGQCGRALACAEAGLYIAQEIDHRQWITAATFLLGRIHLDILAEAEARKYFERGLALADEINSRLWQQTICAVLALAQLGVDDVAGAQALLQSRVPPAALHNNMTGRIVRNSWAELALAAGLPAEALEIANEMLASAAHVAERGPEAMPALLWLQGRALAALGQAEQAEAALHKARQGTQALGARPMLWRVSASLAEMYQGQGRAQQAGAEAAAARAQAAELAADIPDRVLRENFLRQIAALLETHG